jgi:uncharacterized membrane-anchored protein
MHIDKRWVIGLNFFLLLLFVNFSAFRKEHTLSRGTLVLMELAPVDPRSLMQGDYMELRYAAVQSFNQEGIARRGYLVVTLDPQGVARPVRLQQARQPLQGGEQLIRYFKNDWNLQIGAESYFFQEGRADRFAAARYGGLRVDAKGNSVLAGLYDSSRRFIAP